MAAVWGADVDTGVARRALLLVRPREGLANPLSKRTGPTILTTSGVWVPGASWLVFGPCLWANALENAPMPSSATKMATMQKTEAIRIRRLKKADFEVDFFFMNEVEFFPSPVNPRR